MRFKTYAKMLKDPSVLKNFIELERVLSQLGPENFQRDFLEQIRQTPATPPTDGPTIEGSSCLVINQPTTLEDTYVLVPCLVVNSDLVFENDSEVAIIF